MHFRMMAFQIETLSMRVTTVNLIVETILVSQQLYVELRCKRLPLVGDTRAVKLVQW